MESNCTTRSAISEVEGELQLKLGESLYVVQESLERHTKEFVWKAASGVKYSLELDPHLREFFLLYPNGYSAGYEFSSEQYEQLLQELDRIRREE